MFSNFMMNRIKRTLSNVIFILFVLIGVFMLIGLMPFVEKEVLRLILSAKP